MTEEEYRKLCEGKCGKMIQTCEVCRKEKPETTASFHRRTKDLDNPLPFLCRACLKIRRAINPSPKELKERKKYEEKSLNKKIKTTRIKEFMKNPVLLQLKEEERKRMKPIWRHRGADIRAKRAKAFVLLENEEKQKIKIFYENCPEGFHVDHITPISKGGLHILSNLQYLTKKDNLSKGNRLDWNFSQK